MNITNKKFAEIDAEKAFSIYNKYLEFLGEDEDVITLESFIGQLYRAENKAKQSRTNSIVMGLHPQRLSMLVVFNESNQCYNVSIQPSDKMEEYLKEEIDEKTQ